MKHEWRAVDGGPGATVCHMWCASCGSLWEVADPHESKRTNRYFIPGWALEKDRSARPEGGFAEEPDCPPRPIHVDIVVSDPPPSLR